MRNSPIADLAARHVVQRDHARQFAQAHREERRRKIAHQPLAQADVAARPVPRCGPRDRGETAARRIPAPGCDPCAGGSAGCPRARTDASMVSPSRGCPCPRPARAPCLRARRTLDARRVAAIARRLRRRAWRASRASPTASRSFQMAQKMLIAPKSRPFSPTSGKAVTCRCRHSPPVTAHPHRAGDRTCSRRARAPSGRSLGGIGIAVLVDGSEARGPFRGRHFACLVEALVEDLPPPARCSR